jgi:opacity protein-like surface antigen
VFGGQLGYNWQAGNWVFGIEGDVDGYGARNSTHTTGTPTLAVAFTASEAPKWLASARGRVGYAWGTGLIYITDGGAWANMAFNTTDALGVSSITATKSGWTLGGGYEWMFAPNWSLRAEYLYYMFNSGATTATVFPPPGGGAITHTWSGANVQIARVGLNYKFDWGAPSPGVAPWALAAGPGVRAASVAPAPVVVAPTWTGVYLGVNGGWGWTGSNSVSVTLPAAPTFGAFSTGQSSDGAVFGGQLGYNWQTGNWVFGIEGDVDGYGARNATTTPHRQRPKARASCHRERGAELARKRAWPGWVCLGSGPDLHHGRRRLGQHAVQYDRRRSGKLTHCDKVGLDARRRLRVDVCPELVAARRISLLRPPPRCLTLQMWVCSRTLGQAPVSISRASVSITNSTGGAGKAAA